MKESDKVYTMARAIVRASFADCENTRFTCPDTPCKPGCDKHSECKRATLAAKQVIHFLEK